MARMIFIISTNIAVSRDVGLHKFRIRANTSFMLQALAVPKLEARVGQQMNHLEAKVKLRRGFTL